MERNNRLAILYSVSNASLTTNSKAEERYMALKFNENN